MGSKFKRGRGSMEDDGQSGYPKYVTADENIDGRAHPGFVW